MTYISLALKFQMRKIVHRINIKINKQKKINKIKGKKFDKTGAMLATLHYWSNKFNFSYRLHCVYTNKSRKIYKSNDKKKKKKNNNLKL